MFLLKKFSDVREKVHPGHEKSFTGHLEDLRRFITRLVTNPDHLDGDLLHFPLAIA